MIPFDFVVSSQVFPAGTYVIERPLGAPGPYGEIGMVILRSVETHAYKVVVTSLSPLGPEPATGLSHLVFGSDNEKHRLERVEVAGDKVLYQLPGATAAVVAGTSQSTVLIAQN